MLLEFLLAAAILIQPFDLIFEPDADCLVSSCAGIECRVWAIDAESPGAAVPFGAVCLVHSWACTESGPTARFHLQMEIENTRILGFCVRQTFHDRSPGLCLEPFARLSSSSTPAPPVHRVP